MNVTTSLIVGGMNFIQQSSSLSHFPHFIIATPGRLKQHLETNANLSFRNLQFLVLDEADKLISTGFMEDLETILKKITSRSYNKCLFSATITSSLEELSHITLKPNYKSINLTVEKSIPENLTQNYLLVPAKIKICYLAALLFKLFQREFKPSDKDMDGRDEGDEGEGSGIGSYINSSLGELLNEKNEKKRKFQSAAHDKKKKKRNWKDVISSLHDSNNSNDDQKNGKVSSNKTSTSIIIFVGTEATQVYARRSDHAVKPEEHAVKTKRIKREPGLYRREFRA